MRKFFAILISLNVCIATAYADDGWDCFPNPHTCDGVSVKTIYLDFNTKRIYFGNSSYTHYFVMGTGGTWSDEAKAVHSLLLTAKATGSKVNSYSQVDENGVRNVSQIILMAN